MAESTTIYTPDNGGVNATLPWLTMLSQRSGIDTNTLLAMANGGGFGGFGGNMGFFWLFFMFMWMQNGGWNGNQQDLANMIYNREGRDYLMQAIQGNRDAVNNLAGMLNTNISSIQTLLNSVNMGIQQVGNQVGMSGLQVINAIQAGNCELGNKFANCCCETRSLIQQQGYENRLATLQQTDALAARIDAQTTMINDKFCALEMRELQNKLDEIGIRASEYMRAERHLQKAFRDNTGMTYSNLDTRTTVMVIGRSTSEAETVNTFSHELRHLGDDLTEACGIPHHGEEIAYITGDVACALAGSLLRIVCDCPKCSEHE